MRDSGRGRDFAVRVMAARAVQVKLNTDDVPNIATEYGIRSIPTIIMFKDGARIDTIIGAVPKENLVKAIQKHI